MTPEKIESIAGYKPPKRELAEITAELSLIVKELQEINSNDSTKASGFIKQGLNILKGKG